MELESSDESSVTLSRSSTSSLISIIEDNFSFDSEQSFASEEHEDYFSESIGTSNDDSMSWTDDLSEVVDEYDLAIFIFVRQISKVNFTFLEQKRTKFKREL